MSRQSTRQQQNRRRLLDAEKGDWFDLLFGIYLFSINKQIPLSGFVYSMKDVLEKKRKHHEVYKAMIDSNTWERITAAEMRRRKVLVGHNGVLSYIEMQDMYKYDLWG